MTSCIYFIQALGDGDGPIKIGTTQSSPHRRMTNLKTGCPWPVKLLGAIEGTRSQEQQIHAVLAKFKTRGEWFRPHPIVIAAVEAALLHGKPASLFRENQNPNPKRLNGVTELIDALGGNRIIRKLTGAGNSAVSNWKRLGTFPTNTYAAFDKALYERGMKASPTLWKMPVDRPDRMVGDGIVFGFWEPAGVGSTQ